MRAWALAAMWLGAVWLVACGGDGSYGDAGDGYQTSGVPCAVSEVLSTQCTGCHHQPPIQSAPTALLTREDLIASAPGFPDASVAQRCVARMGASTAPMPPSGSLAPAADVLALSAWIDAGMPAGECAQAVACQSGTVFLGVGAGLDMNPGMACRACHLGKNFMGQSPPSGLFGRRSITAWAYMGTVFSALHEANGCVDPVPDGGRVEILDLEGRVAVTMFPQARSGNFSPQVYGADSGTPVFPYTARVVLGGRTLVMATPQTDGDCNTCHTDEGQNGAPGRIVWPH